MPLLTFDLIEGRTEQEVKTLLDAAHRAVLRAFEVPERDRYQIVHENKAHHMVIEDTGLGLTRTRDLVVVRVYTLSLIHISEPTRPSHISRMPSSA